MKKSDIRTRLRVMEMVTEIAAHLNADWQGTHSSHE
jgi:hypothetical protein